MWQPVQAIYYIDIRVRMIPICMGACFTDTDSWILFHTNFWKVYNFWWCWMECISISVLLSSICSSCSVLARCCGAQAFQTISFKVVINWKKLQPKSQKCNILQAIRITILGKFFHCKRSSDYENCFQIARKK